jgi:preprotein translocase subunit SecF
MELFKIKRDIPFMSYGRLTTTISAVTFVLAVIFIAVKGLNLGIDFTGGTLMEIGYTSPVDLVKVRTVLEEQGFKEATVQHFGTAHDVLIRLPLKHDAASAQLSEQVLQILRKRGDTREVVDVAAEHLDLRIEEKSKEES